MKDRCNSVDVALSGEPRKFFVSCEFFFCVFFSILHLTNSRNIVFIPNNMLVSSFMIITRFLLCEVVVIFLVSLQVLLVCEPGGVNFST